MSAVLLIVIPLLMAFLSILSKKLAPYLLLLTSFAAFALLIVDVLPLETITIGGFTAPYGIELVFDKYSLFSLQIVDGLFLLVVLTVWSTHKKMASILLVALAGLNGLLLTGDLFNLFVFLEITAISAYLISTTNKQPIHTFNYVVAGTVGSSLYLLGLILLYNMTGTLNMLDMAIKLVGVNQMAVALPFLLMFIGLGVEAKLMPFASWVKGILGHSDSFSGPMIAGVYAAASLFVFGRLFDTVFVISDSLNLIILLSLSLSILAGEAMAYSSTKVREILLFSSVAQAGIAILAFMQGYTEYAMLFVALNAASKVVLFMIFGSVAKQIGSDNVSDMSGLFVNHKWTGFGVTVIILSLLGLPLFIGFTVKLGLLLSLFNDQNILFIVIILISSVVEGVYFIKLLVELWISEKTPKVKISCQAALIAVLVALVLVALGVYWQPVEQFVDQYLSLRGGWF